MHAGLRPDALRVADGETEISFARWNAIADVAAARSVSLARKPGDRIAVRMSVRHEWFFVHAAARIGALLLLVRLAPSFHPAGQ
ncbi:MAG: hypothetical protein QM813_16305 [Verrucomicrobiota bacterium]